ncbi:MAG: hypothetical protein RLY78_3015 [Pseudomonadota bacterium]|jgi:hypothetical protein
MNGAMNLCLLLLGAAGFALLASAMDRHEREITGRRLAAPERRRRRWAGALALLAALIGLMQGLGSGVGLMVWLMLCSVCGLSVVLLTTYRPHWLGLRHGP